MRTRSSRPGEAARREKRGQQPVTRDSLNGLHRKRETARSLSCQSQQQNVDSSSQTRPLLDGGKIQLESTNS